MVSGQLSPKKVAPRLWLGFELGLDLVLELGGGNFPRRKLSKKHVGSPYCDSPFANLGGHRHCGNTDLMFLGVGKPDSIFSLYSTIFFFSIGHGMSRSHLQNFTMKITLTKTFASVSNDRSSILVTSVLENDWWNTPKKTFAICSKAVTKRKNRENSIAKLFGLQKTTQ